MSLCRRRRRRRRLARNKLDELFFEPLIDITCTRSSSAADLICHCTAWQVALRWLAAAGRVRWSESASSACCLASCLRLPQGAEEGADEREIQAGSLLLAPPFWKWHQLHSKGRESSAFVSLSLFRSLSLALALVIVFNSEVRSCTVSRGSSSSSWSRPHATQLCVCECVLSVLCVLCVCVCVVLPFNYTSWSKLFFSFSSLFSLIWHLFFILIYALPICSCCQHGGPLVFSRVVAVVVPVAVVVAVAAVLLLIYLILVLTLRHSAAALIWRRTHVSQSPIWTRYRRLDKLRIQQQQQQQQLRRCSC